MSEMILKVRTREFALRVVRLYSVLKRQPEEGRVLGKQLLRSGTSVGAHYSEAMHARSRAEFVSKLGGGLQELEETIYWLELLVSSQIMPESQMTKIIDEANQIKAMFISSLNTTKSKR